MTLGSAARTQHSSDHRKDAVQRTGSFPRRTKHTLEHPIPHTSLPLSLFLFISRVTHVILNGAHHPPWNNQQAVKVRNTKQIPVSLMETSKQRRKETNINSPNKKPLFSELLLWPNPKGRRVPVHSAFHLEHIVKWDEKQRGVLFPSISEGNNHFLKRIIKTVLIKLKCCRQ